MEEENWEVIPSIDSVDEHLQDSFDFYAVRVPTVGRRVRRTDLSRLVWAVTRSPVTEAQCSQLCADLFGAADEYLTIGQCETILRANEALATEKFLDDAQTFLQRRSETARPKAEKKKKKRPPATAQAFNPCLCSSPAAAQ